MPNTTSLAHRPTLVSIRNPDSTGVETSNVIPLNPPHRTGTQVIRTSDPTILPPLPEPTIAVPVAAPEPSVAAPLAPQEPNVTAPLPHAPQEQSSETLFDRMANEGFLGKMGAFFAKKAKLCATRPGYFEPFHTDALREMRKEGKRSFPLRPILAWDEHETSEPPRALKNDWRALWMGEMTGAITTTIPAHALDAFPQAPIAAGDIAALATGKDGTVVGIIVLYCHNDVWRDRVWISNGEATDRVLLATVLRFARDGKRSIALKSAPIAPSMERGAFWAWEWAVAPNKGGIWGKMAGWTFAWRAKILTAKMRRQTAASLA